MKRTTLFLLLCWCCLSSSLVRAEWKLIDLTDEAAYYVEEFFEPGVVARVWGMVTREPNQLGSRSAKILWEIDCARSRVRTMMFSFHPNRMGMGDALSVDRSPGEWALPPEDSPQESLFIFACGIEPVAGPKT